MKPSFELTPRLEAQANQNLGIQDMTRDPLFNHVIEEQIFELDTGKCSFCMDWVAEVQPDFPQPQGLKHLSCPPGIVEPTQEGIQ